ncbi:Tryptophan synthase alpha chain [Labilithrix luteola]|uniref:Tryptophan synthase alpha chain n=1 Tax=Labilithrix luteola TaxID=1391654 RepID=A0A0K1Q435_9BACT|nr:hypothetical protein [Labilithrix luteola]AKV00494.1 Tryptophan synthase alpha chain [Labilithrix luteola]
MKRFVSLTITALSLGIVVACGTSRRDVSVGADCASGFCESGPLVFGDASTADADADAAHAEMCPSSRCEEGFGTCANSKFPCDITFSKDVANCGACGVQCPASLPSGAGESICVDGKCGYRCNSDRGDCDGIPDNGCEAYLGWDEANCSACGVKCAEGEECRDGTCRGCPTGKVRCNGQCVDQRSDDNNCGSCGYACSEHIPDDYEPVPFMTWGCGNGLCGSKCAKGRADCNGRHDDGCEVDLVALDNEHCGACDVKCTAPDTCRRILGGNTERTIGCGCDDGYVNCPRWDGDQYLSCVDITSDMANCGGCGMLCPSAGACVGGLCVVRCQESKADCNGVAADGCETNLRSDPSNCGACGHVCDGVPGQPCVEGHCAVEACGGVK